MREIIKPSTLATFNFKSKPKVKVNTAKSKVVVCRPTEKISFPKTGIYWPKKTPSNEPINPPTISRRTKMDGLLNLLPT